MKFCKYCGRRLEDGELCSCPEARAEFSRTHVQPPRPAPPPPPQPGSWDDPYGHYKRSLFHPRAEAGPRGVSVAAHGRAARHNAGALHLHVLQALSSRRTPRSHQRNVHIRFNHGNALVNHGNTLVPVMRNRRPDSKSPAACFAACYDNNYKKAPGAVRVI